MGHGDNIPDGYPKDMNGINLNNDGWIVIIGILIGIIVIMTIIMFIMWYRMRTKINKLQEQFKEGINDEETTVLLKYQKLNSRDKNIIQDTLKTLANNEQPKE